MHIHSQQLRKWQSQTALHCDGFDEVAGEDLKVLTCIALQAALRQHSCTVSFSGCPKYMPGRHFGESLSGKVSSSRYSKIERDSDHLS
jgi:hypothetical protein